MDSISKVDLASELVFVGTFTLLYLMTGRKRNNNNGLNMPPALRSIPILGSMPFLDRPENIHIFFMNKAMEIGDVYTLYLAKSLVLVLNGRKAIQEALVKRSSDFAGRTALPNSVRFNQKLSGIVEHQFDPEFRRYHQLCLTILKQFGFGSGAIMETRIQVEVEDLISKLRAQGQGPIHPEDTVTRSVLNVIASIVYGKRYTDEDTEADELIMITQKFIRKSLDSNVLNFFPWLIHLSRFKNMVESNMVLQERLDEMFLQKIKEASAEDAPECFLKTYLQMEGSEYDQAQLMFIIRDLIFAGTETSSTTLQWAFVLLANHQDIQERLAAEINSVVPRDRLPSLDDQKRLPYVEATILELMRLKTIVPLAIPHSTICDTEVNGFFIPVNTTVFVNLYSAHMDPRVWKDPHEFNPNRFLDESGNVKNRDHMMVFSVGRRSCLGELLARQEVFLFFTSLIQQFKILPPEGMSQIMVEDSVGVTLSPSHYNVRFVPRLHK